MYVAELGVAVATAEVEIGVGSSHLVVSDADVVERLRGRGVTEHLLENEELPRVIAAHHHLMVSKGLTEGVAADLRVDIAVAGYALEYVVHRHPGEGIVAVLVVTLTVEHVIVELRGAIDQIEGNSLYNCVVDRYIAVLLHLASITGLLLKDGELGLEAQVVIYDAGEPQRKKVADTKAEVDAHYEEHVVTVALVFDQKRRDPVDVIHALDRLGGVVDHDLVLDSLSIGGDDIGSELAARYDPQESRSDVLVTGVTGIICCHFVNSFRPCLALATL